MDYIHFDDRENMVEDIAKILQDGSDNDVNIKLSDGEINANKDILCARSEYFKMMFKYDYVENENNVVDLSHVCKSVFQRILDFLFSGKVSFYGMSLKELIKMTQVCDMVLLKNLKDAVSHFIIYDLLPDSGSSLSFLPNLIYGLRIAEEYNLPSIEEAIIGELYFNIWGLIMMNDVPEKSHDFKSLPLRLGKPSIKIKKKV